MTANVIGSGTCFLAFEGDILIGTAMLYPPDESSECELYRQPGTFYFGKFAVGADHQGRGLGKLLFAAVEQAANDQGARILACDTAAPATELIDMYRRWGFEIVSRQNWSMTNYESVVLVKNLYCFHS